LRKLAPFCKMNRNVILYIVFGLLTTVVNYLVYFPLFYLADLSASLSSIIAWFFAVIFSFITNKMYVFKSSDLTCKKVSYEFLCFLGSRLLTGAVETLALFILVDMLQMSGWFWKLTVSGFVVAGNYVTSALVFRRK